MEVNLATYNNADYKPGHLIKRITWFLVNSIFMNSRSLPSSRMRVILLRLFGAKIGRRVVIKPSVNVKYPWFLTVGDNCWIGENVWIDNLCQVTIRNSVCISQGAMLMTGNHDYSSQSFDLVTGAIELHDGVWIGAKSVICPGVVCKSHSILLVNSVATRCLQSYMIYRGNPASKVKRRCVENKSDPYWTNSPINSHSSMIIPRANVS